MNELIMSLIGSIKSLEPEHKKQKIQLTKDKQPKNPRTQKPTITINFHKTSQNQNNQQPTIDSGIHFFKEKEPFSLNFRLAEYILPKGSFFSEMKM